MQCKIKKRMVICLAICSTVLLGGCKGNLHNSKSVSGQLSGVETTSDSSLMDNSSTGSEKENLSNLGSRQISSAKSNGGTTDKNNYTFQFDNELNNSGVSKQFTINMLSGTDDFGRSFEPSSGLKPDKKRYVGIFYFAWLGQHRSEQDGIFDVTKLLKTNPKELWNADSMVSLAGKYHFWGEPLYGYYNSCDPWVIRRHVELLTMAGIDFIVLDATNSFEYFEVADVLFPILQEYYNKGWNVPKVVYYCNNSSNQVVKRLYEGYPDNSGETGLKGTGIYKKGLYKDLWFMPNGKPLIIAATKATNNSSEQKVTDPVLLKFFEFKESQWPIVEDDRKDGFPWIDFRRPQVTYNDVISVSVAQHNLLPFSDAVLDKTVASQMWGRGYTSKGGADHSEKAIRMGLNFEEEWNTAINRDLKYTFITGWNEWIALKLIGSPSAAVPGNPNRVFFVDNFNEEYSRDVEMMKGGYGDNFYMQMARNIRTLKYGKYTKQTNPVKTSINIKKGMAQWKNVKDVYFAMTGKGNRNFMDFSCTENYVDNSLINDIDEIRVTNDNNNLYFLVKCTADINVNLASGRFMNLLIDVDGVKGKSFYGYDYLVNRKMENNGVSSVEKYNYDKGNFNFERKGSAEFTVNKRYMQIKIPLSALGIGSNSFRINFKFADNVSNTGDIQSYYTSGTTAPYGRMNYTYFCK